MPQSRRPCTVASRFRGVCVCVFLCVCVCVENEIRAARSNGPDPSVYAPKIRAQGCTACTTHLVFALHENGGHKDINMGKEIPTAISQADRARQATQSLSTFTRLAARPFYDPSISLPLFLGYVFFFVCLVYHWHHFQATSRSNLCKRHWGRRAVSFI